MAQKAIAYYNLREFDTAEELFETLNKKDPYRLEVQHSLSPTDKQDLIYNCKHLLELGYLLKHIVCERNESKTLVLGPLRINY